MTDPCVNMTSLARGNYAISGLLMELDEHNCWTIAEAAGHRGQAI
jgi:hypothetical protein